MSVAASSLVPSPQDLIAQLTQKLSEAESRLGETQNRLHYAELKIQVLEVRLRQARMAKYGPGSENLSDEQLELLELEPGVSVQEVQAESKRESLPRSQGPIQRKHPGCQSLPPELRRVEVVLACTEEQRVCPQCGQERAVVGHEQSEQLDVEPAQYFVQVTKREKRACRKCEEQGVVTAPLPARIIEKGLASDRVVIDTVVRKYCDHIPLYRQSAILERDTGLELSRATLDGWVLRVGELLMPMVGAMRQELLRGTYIQADETPVKVTVSATPAPRLRAVSSGAQAGRSAPGILLF